MSPSSFESVACPRCGFPELAPLVLLEPVAPAPDFTCTNDLPADSAIVGTRREIAVAETGIAHVEEKMANLERVIDRLRLRRQGLRNFIANHRRVLAPIRRLPNELLSEIFSHCVERDPYEWDPTTNVEWILVLVSRAWRAVSVSMPQMWNRISISDASAPKNIDLKAALSLQLERSARLPLAIDFDFKSASAEQRIFVLETLFSARDRWQVANIHLTQAEVLHFRSGFAFPKLTKLGFSLRPVTDEHTVSSIFRATPALQELCYSDPLVLGPHPTASILQIRSFPLSQLRRLDLLDFGYYPSELSSVLGLACNILDLRLRGSFGLGDQVDPKTLPNLVSLDITEWDSTILGFIIAPVLRRLTISFSRYTQSGISDDLVSFITRTEPSLTDLTVHQAPAREPLLELLALAPHLTSLSIGRMSTVIRSGFIKGLTCGFGARNLVPQLVSLELTGVFQFGHDYSLLDMLKSRCISGPLRSARIGGAEGLTDIQEQLLALGLNLVGLGKKF
ncbi:hypothetical protein B0H16DRAFT_1690200 [Mycena metata]|uniref:F-box domain-containing protein n=1 Tax=Mycena metata TaxID=1033252 RepID=A0AAD7DXE6_9AGAR|nr:hypothetical protein B0H16DRAFT_1705235 [Mycena metata]KAJ7755479.1 hypothetical protein B0H16DRAFT_1690200 [Mycena metata]